MEIINKSIYDIIDYDDNPRYNDEAVDYVKESIKEFGFKVPIIIDENDVIIAGHTRKKAALEIGIKEVPVIVADDLTPQQVDAFRLADNKVAEFSEWDEDLLMSELNKLDDLDMSAFGFEDMELDLEDTEIEEEEIEEDEVVEIPEEPKSKFGQIYQLGNHRLMCGDSTSDEDVSKLMNGQQASLVFTDPPYGAKKQKDGVLNDNLNYDSLLEFNKLWIPLSFKYLKENGSWYCWGLDQPLMDIYTEILKPKIKNNEIVFKNLIT
ncbi:ParB N-terminal domain-containing protein [Staphylococcus epidermidis]|nr:ParB N-terminal domain-containing protein [Staphylococcus epidermidis]